jgi:hypothetical protein
MVGVSGIGYQTLETLTNFVTWQRAEIFKFGFGKK